MIKKKVISRRQLPTRSDILYKGFVAYFACDYYDAPGWVWGVCGCLFFLIVIAVIWNSIHEKETDIMLM